MYKYDREQLIKMIAKHEGVVLHVYKDSLGIDTIGIGRNLAHRGIEVAELDYMQKTMNEIFSDGITVDDAYFLAGNDIDIVELELLRSHSIVSQLDAVRQMVLIDMAFNMGIPRLGKFSKMWNIENTYSSLIFCFEIKLSPVATPLDLFS